MISATSPSEGLCPPGHWHRTAQGASLNPRVTSSPLAVSQSQSSLACPQALAFLRLPVGFGQWEPWRESEAGRIEILGSPAPPSWLAATPSPCLSREPPPASRALGPGLVSKPHCPSLSVQFFVVSLHPEHSFINSLFIMLAFQLSQFECTVCSLPGPKLIRGLGHLWTGCLVLPGIAGQQCRTVQFWSGNTRVHCGLTHWPCWWPLTPFS